MSYKVDRKISDKYRITEQFVRGDYVFCYEYAVKYRKHITWYIAFSSVSSDRETAQKAIIEKAKKRNRKL